MFRCYHVDLEPQNFLQHKFAPIDQLGLFSFSLGTRSKVKDFQAEKESHLFHASFF